MKLVIIGRGAIVDLADLVGALTSKTIGGAALDIFEQEPLPPDHPLWGFPNVILTPHIAGYSPRIAERHLAVLLDNLQRFGRGEPLRNVVNKARLVLSACRHLAAGPGCISELNDRRATIH